MRIEGLWLPLITPFHDGELDEPSLRRLAQHYLAQPVDGLILAATTGEGLTLDDDETARLVEIVAAEVARRIPIFLGVSGSFTRKVAATLAETAALAGRWLSDRLPVLHAAVAGGPLSAFRRARRRDRRPIIIYNIPYRTGVNLLNETLLRLAALPNIVGVKDCCADQVQSFDLAAAKPQGFAVMTGEDALFYNALTQGAEGGILAASHVETAAFASVRNIFISGDQQGALRAWRVLVDLPRLLFAEPSPAPIKHWLWRAGLIDSPEVRLPMMPVSDTLAARIAREIERRAPLAA